MAHSLRLVLTLGVVLLLLVTEIFCRPQILEALPGTEVSQAPRSNLDAKRLIIQDLKSKILKHLKIPQPPTNDVAAPRLSPHVIQILEKEQDLTETEAKEHLIVHSTNSNLSCLNSNESTCQRFEFTIASDLQSVISVHTWLHRAVLSETLLVNIYSSTDREEDPVIKLKERHSKKITESGWMIFEVPKILALESKDGQLHCTIEIQGLSIDAEIDQNPFLVITKILDEPKRKKRTINSNENCNNGCCVESYTVTVEELDWKSWVISPQVFDIRTCKGRCADTHSLYRTNYQTVMSTLHKLNTTLQRPPCSFWTLSCKPTNYLPLRLMYDNNGTIHDQIIPKMIIESCNCS